MFIIIIIIIRSCNIFSSSPLDKKGHKMHLCTDGVFLERSETSPE